MYPMQQQEGAKKDQRRRWLVFVTCIVGLVDNGTVYIGGDSAGVAGYDLTVRKDEKVFINGSFIFGFTSSFRMGQLLRYKFKPPYRVPDMTIEEYMCTTFIDGVRSCLKDGGFARTENGEESAGTFIVGHNGRLFVIDSDFQVGESIHTFAAVGCGAQAALGAMYATMNLDPEDRIRIALEAAEQFNAGVRRPFVIRELR